MNIKFQKLKQSENHVVSTFEIYIYTKVVEMKEEQRAYFSAVTN